MHAIGRAILSGAAGACALTLLHEATRRIVSGAPRLDILGMRSLAKGFRLAGHEAPREPVLHKQAFVGDLLLNTVYYAAIGMAQQRSTLDRC